MLPAVTQDGSQDINKKCSVNTQRGQFEHHRFPTSIVAYEFKKSNERARRNRTVFLSSFLEDAFSTLLYGNTVDPEPVHISLYLLADNTEHSSVYLVNIAD